MKVSNTNVEIRTSTLSGAVKCRLQTLLKIYDALEAVPYDTPQLLYGRTVHDEIYKTMLNLPDQIPHELLDHPHPKIDPCITSKVLIGGPKVGKYKELPDGVIVYDLPIDTYKYPLRDASIRELLHPKMFGPEISVFEHPLEYTWDFSGKTVTVPVGSLSSPPDPEWIPLKEGNSIIGYSIPLGEFKLKITGTLDFATKSGSIIGDWKTSAVTPQEDAMPDHVNYYKQIAIYKWLWCKMNNLPLKNFYGILVYLVKTKTPKMCIRPFRFTDLYLKETETFINSVLEDLMIHVTTGIYPRYSTGNCFNCSVAQKCETLNRKLPRPIELSSIQEEE